MEIPSRNRSGAPQDEKINRGCTSLNRVWQKGKYFRDLPATMGAGQVGNADRWALLVGYRALVQAGLISYVDVIALLQSYLNESNPLVAPEVAAAFCRLHSLFVNSKLQLLAIAKKTDSTILANIGRNAKLAETNNVKIRHAFLFDGLSLVEPDNKIVAYLIRLWKQFLADRNSVDANLVSLLLRIGMRYVDAFDVALETNRPDAKLEIKSMAPIERLDEVLRTARTAQL
jgi:hypothetical protein